MSGLPVLSAAGISVALGGRPVLDAVDLELRAGEHVGLIGPNGAGKTTLLRALLGLVPASSGRVTLAGAAGYVPQRHEFAWDYPLNVCEAVLSALARRVGWLRAPRSEHRAAVADALALTDLTALRERPIGELSGGQRQRLLVARALALRPRVLLLDEPFTALDASSQALLASLFAQLCGDGVAILMTTHDLAGAAAACDRLVLLNRSVLGAGPPHELRDAPGWLLTFGAAA